MTAPLPTTATAAMRNGTQAACCLVEHLIGRANGATSDDIADEIVDAFADELTVFIRNAHADENAASRLLSFVYVLGRVIGAALLAGGADSGEVKP